MKKRGIIILSIVGVLIIGAGGVCVWQWNNIKALYYFLTFSDDKITEQLTQNEDAIASVMQKVPEVTLRDLTDDERAQLESGELSHEDAIQLILGNIAVGAANTGTGDGTGNAAGNSGGSGGNASGSGGSDSSGNGSGNGSSGSGLVEGGTSGGGSGNNTVGGSGNDSNDGSANVSGNGNGSTSGTGSASSGNLGGNNASSVHTSPAATVDPNDPNAKLAVLLAEIYMTKASFVSKLDGLMNTAIKEYRSLSEAERTNANIQKLGMKYLDTAGSMEKECDALMDSLLKQIEAELKTIGGDTSLVSDIKAIYVNEKSLRKAEYLSKYK